MQANISEKDLVIQGETVPVSHFVSLKHFADSLFTSRIHIHLLHYQLPYICIYSIHLLASVTVLNYVEKEMLFYDYSLFKYLQIHYFTSFLQSLCLPKCNNFTTKFKQITMGCVHQQSVNGIQQFLWPAAMDCLALILVLCFDL